MLSLALDDLNFAQFVNETSCRQNPSKIHYRPKSPCLTASCASPQEGRRYLILRTHLCASGHARRLCIQAQDWWCHQSIHACSRIQYYHTSISAARCSSVCNRPHFTPRSQRKAGTFQTIDGKGSKMFKERRGHTRRWFRRERLPWPENRKGAWVATSGPRGDVRSPAPSRSSRQLTSPARHRRARGRTVWWG